MTPDKLANDLDKVIIAANRTLADGITTVQDYVYKNLVNILKGLETDDEGYIIQSAANRQIIQRAINSIDVRVAKSSYDSDIETYLGTTKKIDVLNISYFEAISDAFSANKQFLNSLKKEAIATVEDLLLNSGFESQIKIPLGQILNQNINSGGSFTGLLDQVKTYIKGSADADGRLLRYAKAVTRDTLFNYSRTYQQSISSDLGLEWYYYSGGLIDKSRPFCIERHDHVYHQKEVESWASLDWAGKAPGTTESSIFIYAGGVNCGHSLIPVHILVVPEEDIKHAGELGFYKK